MPQHRRDSFAEKVDALWKGLPATRGLFEIHAEEQEAALALTDALSFVRSAHAYARMSNRPTVEGFLRAGKMLHEDSDTWAPLAPPAEGAVRLLTVHASKGLEFEAVFVSGLLDERFPIRPRGVRFVDPGLLSDGSPTPRARLDQGHLFEERRLFYVALTRARTYLFLTGIEERSEDGLKASTFLRELEDRLVELAETARSRRFWVSREEAIEDLRRAACDRELPQPSRFAAARALARMGESPETWWRYLEPTTGTPVPPELGDLRARELLLHLECPRRAFMERISTGPARRGGTGRMIFGSVFGDGLRRFLAGEDESLRDAMLATVEARDFGGPAFKEYWRRQALDAVASCEEWARETREKLITPGGEWEIEVAGHTVRGRHGPVVDESGEHVLLRVKTGKNPMTYADAAADPDLALSALGADVDRAKYVYPRKLSYGAPAERELDTSDGLEGFGVQAASAVAEMEAGEIPAAPGAPRSAAAAPSSASAPAHGGRTVGRMRGPTPEQAAVIRLDRGPARVLAGAGSGKTFTMTELVSYRVDEYLRKLGGTAPERILALTFTVKAADEMRSRLISRLGEQALKLTVANFHSYALQIVRENAAMLGLEPDAPVLRRGRAWLMVLDELAARDLALRRLDLSDPAGAADKVLTLLSQAKNDLVDLGTLRRRTEEDLSRADTDGLVRVFEERLDLIELAQRFEVRRTARGLLRYEDMIELGAHVLDDPILGEPYKDRYEFVVVDEFQDTNPAQLRFVELLAGGDLSKVVVIGDDLQSIYNFTGASVRNIQRFEEEAGVDVGSHTYPLAVNFRSGERILALANHIARAVHPESSPDQPKILLPRDGAPQGHIEAFAEVSDAEEGREISRRIQTLIEDGAEPSSCAVLIRRWSQARPILAALTEAGIPARSSRAATSSPAPKSASSQTTCALRPAPAAPGRAFSASSPALLPSSTLTTSASSSPSARRQPCAPPGRSPVSHRLPASASETFRGSSACWRWRWRRPTLWELSSSGPSR